MTVPEKAVRAVLAKAELLNGGASLGENGAALAEIAVEKALAYCQRRDMPEDMEQAVAALALALYGMVPRREASGGPEGASGTAGGLSGSWEALLAAGAVKSVQRGDTAITFSASSGSAAFQALGGSAARLTAEAALEELKPWRRLGRLKEPEGGRKNA